LRGETLTATHEAEDGHAGEAEPAGECPGDGPACRVRVRRW
jgi:hypothetical protein